MTMTSKEMIFETLQRMGYNPEIDEDGDIMMYYQMKIIYLFPSRDEDSYICMMLPKFYEVAEGRESAVLAACNKLNRDIRIVKYYIDDDFKSVTATCEFFYNDNESLECFIEKSLGVIAVVRTLFKREMAELLKAE